MCIKRKMAALPLVVLLVFSGCGQKAAPLNVPKSESVASIKVQNGTQTNDYDEPAYIDEFVNILLSAEPTAKRSTSDRPKAEGAVFVSLIGGSTEDNTDFFVYNADDKTYIEIPHEGIWEAAPALYFGAVTGRFADMP